MRKILMVAMVVTLLMAGAVTASASSLEPVEGRTFPAGTLVIPMDDHQDQRLEAFGLVHALLSEGITIFRILQSDADPVDVLETDEHPLGGDYSGGPILVEEEIPPAIAAEFPLVTVHTLSEEYTSDRVFRAGAPTEILVIYGVFGHTQDVLDGMKIPYDMVDRSDVEADPDMLANYNLVVVDCPGWAGPPPSQVAAALESFVAAGGEAIFTDIALLDLVAVFPGYVTVVGNVDGTWNFDVHNVGEFPSQYHGPSPLPIYTMGGGYIASEVLDPEVRVILDIEDYAGAYRIGAFYFPYGDGVVEGFAYHPGDQGAVGEDSMILSAALYGNKFIHVLPPPQIEVDLDIRPMSDPNPLNTRARGVLPVAILGTEDFDVTQIDPETLLLEGVAPLWWSFEDVGTSGDTLAGPDGYMDLVLHFDNQCIVAAVGPVARGDVLTLQLTGNLKEEFGGTPIVGEDVVVVVG